MGAPQAKRMNVRDERRAIVALFAVFALLVQALVPGIAAAASGGRDTICVATGVHHGGARDSAPDGHGMGAGCDHCVCPAPAAPPSAAAALVQPVRYAIAAVHDLARANPCAPGRGLAAPPPPCRGPPSLI